MRFEWDTNKNRKNLLKHDVRFETAVLAFDDPYALTQRDDSSGEEERWITLGAIGPGAVLLVVHTCRGAERDEVIRIISARAAAAHEKRKYEEANKTAKARRSRHRDKERRRH